MNLKFLFYCFLRNDFIIVFISFYCIANKEIFSAIKSKLKVILPSGCVVTLGLCIVACSTNYWSRNKGRNWDYNAGLWKRCNNVEAFGCITFETFYKDYLQIPIPSWLIIVRSFAAVSCCFAGTSLLMSILGFAYRRIKNFVVSIFLLLAAISMTIALSYFIHIFNDSVLDHRNSKFGWSFIIGWASCLVAMVASFVGFLDLKYLDDDVQNDIEIDTLTMQTEA